MTQLYHTVVPPCTTGDYRVRNETYIYDETGTTTIYSGRVEVCVDGRYIALCDSGFSAQTAELACRSAGYELPFFRKLIRFGLHRISVCMLDILRLQFVFTTL